MSIPFQPPSPGSWELERTHMTRPMSRFGIAIFPPAMMRGFRQSSQHYGVLLDYLEVAVINGFLYACPRPVGAPKSDKGPPPPWLFKLLTKVHPEIRRRVRRADEVFKNRVWRQDLKWWDEEIKPGMIEEARAIATTEITRSSMPEFVAHLRRAVAFMSRAVEMHHRFNCTVMVPQADYLVHAVEWTGLSPSDVLETLQGLSPISAGAVDELNRLTDAMSADPTAKSLLVSDAPASDILEELQRRPGPVGAAFREYLDLVGLRILGGYDLGTPHARDNPALLVRIIRAALGEGPRSGRAEAALEATNAVRARVPAAHRDEFDALLQEARLTYRVRDERNFYGDALAAGLLRRAVLEGGRRLCDKGRMIAPEHAVDTTEVELVNLLEGREGPSASELAERVRYRVETPIESAPPRLGPPPSPPPAMDFLPPSAARLQRGVELMLVQMFGVHEARPQGKTLRGFPASAGAYEGSARVVRDPSELASVKAGEILVTPATSPTFNVVLPLLGALVTERGGALSHAAIVAREYGLPAVVGCRGALETIQTGMRLRVDGRTGELQILG
jgi:pyruvate,water dikinase